MHLRKAAEDVSVLKMRCSINADTMTKAELHQKLKTGYSGKRPSYMILNSP